MSTSQPNFRSLITLAEVATRGLTSDPLVPIGDPAASYASRVLSPSQPGAPLIGGRASADGPTRASPFRDGSLLQPEPYAAPIRASVVGSFDATPLGGGADHRHLGVATDQANALPGSHMTTSPVRDGYQVRRPPGHFPMGGNPAAGPSAPLFCGAARSSVRFDASPIRDGALPDGHEAVPLPQDNIPPWPAQSTTPIGVNAAGDLIELPADNVHPPAPCDPAPFRAGASPVSGLEASLFGDGPRAPPVSSAAPLGAGAMGALMMCCYKKRREALRPPVRAPIPKYKGYGDSISANDFLEDLLHYQQATGMVDQEVLGRVLPVALTDQAARWFRLCGQNALTLDRFRTLRMRRELELRTQHPDESLLEYVRAMQELFLLADPSAPNIAERVERVIRQAHPTFSAYLRGSRFHSLDDLALEARRIQGDILAARAYRPPPPPTASLEPRCAWNGDTVAPHSRRAEASTAYADARGRDAREISDRALDPYSYGLRKSAAKSQSGPHNARRGDLETSLSLRTRGGIPRDLPDGTLWLPNFDAIAVTALVTWLKTARIHRHRKTGKAAANEAGGSTEGWSTWFCSSAVGVPGRWSVQCARPFSESNFAVSCDSTLFRTSAVVPATPTEEEPFAEPPAAAPASFPLSSRNNRGHAGDAVSRKPVVDPAAARPPLLGSERRRGVPNEPPECLGVPSGLSHFCTRSIMQARGSGLECRCPPLWRKCFPLLGKLAPSTHATPFRRLCSPPPEKRLERHGLALPCCSPDGGPPRDLCGSCRLPTPLGDSNFSPVGLASVRRLAVSVLEWLEAWPTGALLARSVTPDTRGEERPAMAGHFAILETARPIGGVCQKPPCRRPRSMQGYHRQRLRRLRRRRRALGPGVSVAGITVAGRGWSGRRRRLCPGLEIDVGVVAGIVVAAPGRIGFWGADAACLPHLEQLRSGSLWPPGPPRTAPSQIFCTF
ncbi:hypothetical protein HPB47_025937 [Ixodes persulcatus]|uniref:Uncharacterized protein n=1 Tax=Ixodes persulcatus TaxID=34615 RepID=A0AC60Q0J4_IXOPE|nr:hypothetical protein HPB47_025937 [Ixodes persulcatus]